MNAILSEPNNDIVLTNKLNEKRYSNYSKIDEIKNWDYSEIYPIVGMKYHETNDSHLGHFIGFAVCENSSFDKYAIAIYDYDYKTLLGYIPKEENRVLNMYISKYYNKKIFVWGYIKKDRESNNYRGNVQLPIGLDFEQIDEIKNMFNMVSYYSENSHIEDSENYLKLLENDLKIKSTLKKFP